MKKKTIRKTFPALILLILAGIITIVMSVVDFKVVNPNKRFVSLSLTLTYEGAANGLTPTGEVFTIDGLKSIDIINRALDELEYRRYYKAEDIYNNLTITGSYPSDVIDRIQEWDSLYDFSASRTVQQTAYYPTVFNISLYDGFGSSVPESDLNAIITKIVDIYKDKLLGEYVYGFKKSAINDVIDLSDTDYRYQLEILTERFNILNAYARELYLDNIGFNYNNTGFNDICVKCANIVSTDLSGLEAMIMVNGGSKSPSRLRNQYQYNVNQLLNRLEQAQNNLNEIDELISGYEMDDILFVGVGDSYVKVESNSTQTYEELIDRRLAITDTITALNSELSKYRQYINDLDAGKASANDDLQNRIETIAEKLDILEEDFQSMVYAYNDSLINSGNIIIGKTAYSSPSLLSGSFIKRVVKFALPVFIIAMMFFCIYCIVIEVRK